MESYPVGKTLPVYHHPENLEKTRLTAKEPRQEVSLDFMFAGLFTLSGFGGLYAVRGILRRQGKGGR